MASLFSAGFFKQLRFDVIIIATALAWFASPVQAVDTAPTLVLTGHAEISATPDMAVINIGTVTDNADAKTALDHNNKRIKAILNALKFSGIDAADLQTSSFSVQPNIVYPKDKSHSGPSGPEIVGYTVRNTIQVQLRDLTKIGDVLGQAVSLGANSVSGPDFALTDSSSLETEARKTAMRQAIAKAQDYAEAANVSLNAIISIEETNNVRGPDRPMMMMAREAAANTVPIATGEISYGASVTVTWEIGQ